MKEVLRTENLTKTFTRPGKEPFTAVNHVNLSLGEGEIVGVVGKSGSGKSTIAKLLTGLIPPTDGKIFLEGSEITGLTGRELRGIYRKIQMVFQEPVGSFNPRQTLGQGIGESLRNSGRSRADTANRVGELLELCGLPADFAKRYPYEVSGGQCQRAAIARALAIEPKILICDEATSALDVTVQQQILELLGKLQQENHMSYLFICHNLALVQMFCHRVFILSAGKIVEEGTPEQVILHPQSDYTKGLVEAAF